MIAKVVIAHVGIGQFVRIAARLIELPDFVLRHQLHWTPHFVIMVTRVYFP